MSPTFNNIARVLTFWCALAGSWDRLPPEPTSMSPGVAARSADHTFEQAWGRRVGRYCKVDTVIARCSDGISLNQMLWPAQRQAWLRVDKMRGLLPATPRDSVRIWIRDK